MGKSRSHQKSKKSPRDVLREDKLRDTETVALLDSASAVLEYRQFDKAAQVIFDCCKRLTGAVAGYVAILSADGTENEVVHLDAGGLPCAVDPNLPMPIRGLRAEAYRTGKVVYDNDFANSEWMKFMPPGHAVLGNVLFVPLFIKGQAVGLLGLANKPGGFTDDDARLTTLFGEFAALALQNSKTLNALENSEQRHRDLVETTNDWIWEVDRNGVYTYASPKVKDLLGYEPGEVIGKTPFDFMSPKEAKRVSALFSEIVSTKLPFERLENTNIHKDGQPIVLETSGMPISGENGELIGYRGIDRDITKRKQAQEEIKRWVAFPRENPHPVLALKPDGTVDHMNPSAQSFAAKIGRAGVGISAILPPDVADIVTERLRTQSGREGVDVSIGDTVLSWSFNPLSSGQFVYAYGYDVTDRKRAEQALEEALEDLESRVLQRTAELTKTTKHLQREIMERKQIEKELRFSETRLRNAQRVAHMGSWDWDIQTNALYWSDEIFQIFGLDPHQCDMTYAAFLDCVHPEDRGWVQSHVDAALHEDKEYSIDHRIVRPDGEIRHIHEQGEVTHDTNGTPIRMFGTVIDITARKRAEEQARQHLSELAHVSRLSTMGEMATAIAHELNQPLTAILSSAQACLRLMQVEPCDYTTVHTGMERVVAQAKRAGEIIRRLKDFSRKRRFHRSTIDINRVVREAAGFLAHETAKGSVRMRLELADTLPAVIGDTTEVEQVIVNLVRNGCEAMHNMPQHQRILTIRTEATDSEMVEIAVYDRGQGFDNTGIGHIEQIFEAFFTTKTDGMGIGLSISRSIIEAYGGRLWATHNPDGGMTFRFTLPAAMDDK